jgi:hypothetical protein
MNLSEFTYNSVKATFKAHDYPLEPNEITVFGKRSIGWKIDAWDDILGIVYQDTVLTAFGTTKPGKAPLSREDGVNKDGVFILRPNFYKNCWQKGLHKGKYRALVQFGDGIFEGWRDNDHDGLFDINAVLFKNVRGLNFHTTRWDKKVVRVGDFSEGCSVVHDAQQYDKIMDVVYGSNQALFSYALFQE